MDLKDSITFATEYLGRYFGDLIDVLCHPTTAFVPTSRSASSTILSPNDSSFVREQFNPSLLGFAAISFLLGFALQSFAGGVAKDQNPLIYGGSVLVVWFALGVLSAVTSRVLGGQRSVVETVSYVIQVLAACFVLASAGFLFSHLVPKHLRPPVTSDADIDDTIVYLALQFLLAVGYLAVGMARLQRFGWIRTSIQALLVAFSLLFMNVGAALTRRPPAAAPPQKVQAGRCAETVARAVEELARAGGLEIAQQADDPSYVALISPTKSPGSATTTESNVDAFEKSCMLFERIYRDNQRMTTALRDYLVTIQMNPRSVKERDMLALGFTPGDVSHLVEHLTQWRPTWSIQVEYRPAIGLRAEVDRPSPDAEATLKGLETIRELAARCEATQASGVAR